MAERYRSNDGKKETEKFVSDYDTPSQQGRAEGNLERKVGTRDEKRQVTEGEVTTRVTRSDELDEDA